MRRLGALLGRGRECARTAAHRPWLAVERTACNATFLLQRAAAPSTLPPKVPTWPSTQVLKTAMMGDTAAAWAGARRLGDSPSSLPPDSTDSAIRLLPTGQAVAGRAARARQRLGANWLIAAEGSSQLGACTLTPPAGGEGQWSWRRRRQQRSPRRSPAGSTAAAAAEVTAEEAAAPPSTTTGAPSHDAHMHAHDDPHDADPPKGAVAIVTTWDGIVNGLYHCSLLYWCQSAAALGSVLTAQVGVSAADLVMLITSSNTSRRSQDDMVMAVLKQECPALTRAARVPPRLQQTVASYMEERINRNGTEAKEHGLGRERFGAGNLYKWWFTSLSEYELILYADLDVELMPLQVQPKEVAARWLATWQAAVPPSGHPRLYGAADNWSPFNGGLWTLAHPSRELYELGLALLECTSWNATHGFNLMGRPRKLANAHPRVRQMLVPSTQLQVKDTRRKTRAYGENTWCVWLHRPRPSGAPLGCYWAVWASLPMHT